MTSRKLDYNVLADYFPYPFTSKKVVVAKRKPKRRKIDYEWVVCNLDEFGDIDNRDHFEGTKAGLIKAKARIEELAKEGVACEIELMRDGDPLNTAAVGSAYMEDEFLDGQKVPKRIRKAWMEVF